MIVSTVQAVGLTPEVGGPASRLNHGLASVVAWCGQSLLADRGMPRGLSLPFSFNCPPPPPAAAPPPREAFRLSRADFFEGFHLFAPLVPKLGKGL